MTLINPVQPIRTRYEEDNSLLLYRTRPRRGKMVLRIDSPHNQIAQMRLYRAVRAGEVPEVVSIADLYEFLFFDIKHKVSKTNLGYVVTNSVIYEPRKLKNNQHMEKAMMTYSFMNIRELEYGLEWQICIWLRKFVKEFMGIDIKNPAQMDAELDALANADQTEYMQNYEANINEFRYPIIFWEENSQMLGWSWEEDLPPDIAQTNTKKPPRPRDLSGRIINDK